MEISYWGPVQYSLSLYAADTGVNHKRKDGKPCRLVVTDIYFLVRTELQNELHLLNATTGTFSPLVYMHEMIEKQNEDNELYLLNASTGTFFPVANMHESLQGFVTTDI